MPTPMKVLLVHNQYRSGAPGGEDVAFAQERALLESAGVEVVAYTRSNDEVDERNPLEAALTAWNLRWSARTHREIGALLERERPAVAHFHNTFPLVSASGYAACRERGVPVVQTLHNYRTVCAAATFYRDGRVCELCRPGAPWPAVRHRCYRGSAPGSLAVAWMLWRHWRDGVFTELVDRFIVLTPFAARRLEAAGIPRERILVKPNAVAPPPPPPAGPPGGRYALYAGRLSEEKGIGTLLDAWREVPDLPLKIAGDGPLMAALAARVRAESLPVELLGMVPREEVLRLMAGALVQVVPSRCYEGALPLVAIEAWASGVPMAASRIGSLAEMIEDGRTGLLSEPGDAAGLASGLRRLADDPSLRVRLAAAGREAYRALFTPEHSRAALLGLYRELAAAAPRRRAARAGDAAARVVAP
jgi:glycosyltransferase involved in cell wall biosynthesis